MAGAVALRARQNLLRSWKDEAQPNLQALDPWLVCAGANSSHCLAICSGITLVLGGIDPRDTPHICPSAYRHAGDRRWPASRACVAGSLHHQRSIAYLKREIRTQAMAKPVQRIGRRDVS